MDEQRKPPRGLTPRFIWDGQRLKEINDAILRYKAAKKEVPPAWVTERNSLRRSMGMGKKGT